MVDKGITLLGGTPSCRIRMIKPWSWEFIVDPLVDDDFNPLWVEAKEDIELIYGGDKLMMVLLVFAAENGDQTEIFEVICSISCIIKLS
ncbi:hypothetical protein [Halobacteriovorax sp. DPLXC-1]|uniref:hypothetical protein n=1 Tax=Halobacteriovorax sp. DPLXC-1 TaxID=3110771 RepID=UPI002FF3F5B6